MTQMPGLGGVGGTERGEESTGEVQHDAPHPAPRLAKSTLTLIPLLGTHEVIFAFVMDEHARGMLRFIKLFTELSFTSFQVTLQLDGPGRGWGGGDQPPHADGQPEGLVEGGHSGPSPGYMFGADPEPESRPAIFIRTLDHKPSQMLPWAPSLEGNCHPFSCYPGGGGGHPATCFTHTMQLILTVSQELCRVIPFYRGGK